MHVFVGGRFNTPKFGKEEDPFDVDFGAQYITSWPQYQEPHRQYDFNKPFHLVLFIFSFFLYFIYCGDSIL